MLTPQQETDSWRDIPGYEGYYQASTLGDIRSIDRIVEFSNKRTQYIKGGIVPQYKHNNDRGLPYLNTHLCRDGETKTFLVHQLILLTFVGPCPEGMQIRHFPDQNPSNNKLENLRYSTPSENNMDKIVHGTMIHGSNIASSKLSEDDVLTIVRRYNNSSKSRGKKTDLARDYGVTPTVIGGILNGTRWGWLTGIKKNL